MKKHNAKKNFKPAAKPNRLNNQIPEELRDTASGTLEQEIYRNNSNNEENRGDSLAEDMAPLFQQPEHDTAISSDLIQQRAYALYEQRVAAGTQPDPLTDWFEAERSLIEETAEKAW